MPEKEKTNYKELYEELKTENEKLKETQIELEKKMIELSERDSLTGLYNRRVFMERLIAEIERNKRYNPPVSLLMFDIDRFKRINDTYGRKAGDQVLASVAQHCGGIIRSIDVLCRYGGEEFMLILPHTSLSQAVVVATKLQEGISKLKTAIPISVTASIGIVEYHDEELDTFINYVEEKTYIAKQKGRNRIVT